MEGRNLKSRKTIEVARKGLTGGRTDTFI